MLFVTTTKRDVYINPYKVGYCEPGDGGLSTKIFLFAQGGMVVIEVEGLVASVAAKLGAKVVPGEYEMVVEAGEGD